MTHERTYEGSELELFRHARNWKAYVRRHLAPYLTGRVVEVGAGLGSTTQALMSPSVDDWLCLEPDPAMAGALAEQISRGELPAPCRVRCGTVDSIAAGERFDVALYIDVLEHIEDDAAELEKVGLVLDPGGRIVVLSPAHPWLFSPFDAAIGHFRRYRRSDAARLTPAGMTPERAGYLDSAGLALSAANKLILRRSMPTLRQIIIWDRLIVPLSRRIDPLFGHRLGKSVLFVWRKA